jgi:predicted phosphohydrolase
MTCVAWLSDIHLNFLADRDVDAFLDEVRSTEPDVILLGGDVGESRDVCEYLERFASAVPCPIYFVLGNHDFYFGSIAEVRERVRQLCRRVPNLHYLSDLDALKLAPNVGLVGHDGWADGRLGDYERSYVMMNDYRLIAELAGVGKQARLPLLHALGDEAGGHVRRVLPAAMDRYPQVFLLTHVPPLREACWHEGQLSDDEWAPHFTCLAVGEAILEVARSHPQCQLTVLCGHTHGAGQAQPLPNVIIYTAGAEYGHPSIARVWDL